MKLNEFDEKFKKMNYRNFYIKIFIKLYEQLFFRHVIMNCYCFNFLILFFIIFSSFFHRFSRFSFNDIWKTRSQTINWYLLTSQRAKFFAWYFVFWTRFEWNHEHRRRYAWNSLNSIVCACYDVDIRKHQRITKNNKDIIEIRTSCYRNVCDRAIAMIWIYWFEYETAIICFTSNIIWLTRIYGQQPFAWWLTGTL